MFHFSFLNIYFTTPQVLSRMSTGDTLIKLAKDGKLSDVQSHLRTHPNDVNYQDKASTYVIK